MKYYTSDLHLFHDKCIEFDNKPFGNIEEMNEAIKSRWNSKITNGDDVYILGDVAMHNNDERVVSFVANLKGNKHLILGNHSKGADDLRFRQLFCEICDYKELTDCNQSLVLCHYPIFSWKNMHRGWIHLYGHVHNSHENNMYTYTVAKLNEFYKQRDGEKYKPIRAFNVGCMYWNYEPVTIKEILEGEKNGVFEKSRRAVSD